jgi:anti-anti-sigma regulatory factor
MLGKLLMVKRRMESKGGKLKLCNLDPEVLEAFRSTNLDHILDIRDSELDALKAFG